MKIHKNEKLHDFFPSYNLTNYTAFMSVYYAMTMRYMRENIVTSKHLRLMVENHNAYNIYCYNQLSNTFNFFLSCLFISHIMPLRIIHFQFLYLQSSTAQIFNL